MQAEGANRAAGPIPKPNMRDEIARRLRSEIFAGQRSFGSKVDQDELAAALGVSRVPVREALIALEREGVIEWRARLGAYVAEITEEDIRDHFEVTANLQVLATRRTIERATDSDLDLVGEVLNQFGCCRGCDPGDVPDSRRGPHRRATKERLLGLTRAAELAGRPGQGAS